MIREERRSGGGTVRARNGSGVMARELLFALLALASCSKSTSADLPAIAEARSLAAEWALVNEQARQGNLTSTYAITMRERVREQLQATGASLQQPHSRYAAEITSLLRQPDDASPEELRAHVRTLKQLEDQLEST